MEDKKREGKTHYPCTNCKRIFSKKFNLQQHYKTHLDRDLRDTYSCYHCEKKFCSKRGLTKHLSLCNKNTKNNNSNAQVQQKVKCAMSTCLYEDSQINMLKHYNQQHDIEIFTECIKFNSFDEFEKWKDETEKSNISKYTRHDSRKSASKVHYYYRCHRDGVYKNGGKNIRHLKTVGSNKINGYCPSKLRVTVDNDTGHVCVKFVKTHVGHQMDLKKIPLGKVERNALASKLRLQMPFDEILHSVRDNLGARGHLLTRKDLYNINSSLKQHDCASVQAWIKEMQENHCDSVIRFYKGQGEHNETYSELKQEDFVLIIMNDIQLDMLKEYGNKCICVDSSHGQNGYSFQLTTLMVLNDLRQPVPCLFMFSNRSDSVIFHIVFKVLHNIVDVPLTPTVFLSDMTDSLYNAWSDVMGPVHFKLFSSWHILRDWKTNIYSKIKNTQKQTSVHNIVRNLLEQLDENAFEQMLDNFIDSTETDVELKQIGRYFKNNYYSNRKSWAYCYVIKHAGLNKTMQRMQRALESIYLKCKTAKRLHKVINDIMTLVRDTVYNRLIILHKDKVSTKLSAVRKIHDNMEQMKDKPIIKQQDGHWILSLANEREIYKIQTANASCKCELNCMKCDTCVHSYVCTCPDSSVQWNMCVHIHLLCQSGLTNTRPNLTSNDNHLYIHFDGTFEEKEIVFKQITRAVSSIKTNICRTDKDKLGEKFQSILKLATTTEQCDVIDKALTNLATKLTAMESS